MNIFDNIILCLYDFSFHTISNTLLIGCFKKTVYITTDIAIQTGLSNINKEDFKKSFIVDKLFYLSSTQTKEDVLVPGLPLHFMPTAMSNFPEIVDSLLLRYKIKDFDEDGNRNVLVIGAGRNFSYMLHCHLLKQHLEKNYNLKLFERTLKNLDGEKLHKITVIDKNNIQYN